MLTDYMKTKLGLIGRIQCWSFYLLNKTHGVLHKSHSRCVYFFHIKKEETIYAQTGKYVKLICIKVNLCTFSLNMPKPTKFHTCINFVKNPFFLISLKLNVRDFLPAGGMTKHSITS